MSRREKVILIVMILVIAGGAYSFFFSSSETGNIGMKKEGGDLNRFVIEMAEKLQKKDISKTYKYIIARAQAEWSNDPFLPSEAALSSESESKGYKERGDFSARDVKFVYSGYLNISDQKLAIINGMEYEAGENLELDGFFVKSISPKQAVIGVKEGNNTIVLPLQEID